MYHSLTDDQLVFPLVLYRVYTSVLYSLVLRSLYQFQFNKGQQGATGAGKYRGYWWYYRGSIVRGSSYRGVD